MNSDNVLIQSIKKAAKIVIVIFLLYATLMFVSGVWDFVALLFYITYFVLAVIGVIITIKILYHTIFERLHCEISREKSKLVLVDDMGKTRQTSGDTRAGKDTSVVGSSKLIAEVELERDLQELETLRNILYIYDFERLHQFIDVHGKQFLVSGSDRLKRRFITILYSRKSFLKDHYINRGIINPHEHIKEYLKYRGVKVLKYSFQDGLTPGGIPFLDLLFDYIVLYTYRVFVTNYVMSNQPILESLHIDEDGTIRKQFSKIFSQKYIRIKEDNPVPFPLRGVIIETEMAIMLSNTDKEGEAEAKSINGIREFLTVVGHILNERVYVYSLTQDPNRVIKAVRELYQTYIHVFKKEEVVTSPIRRKLYASRIETYRKKIKRNDLLLKLSKHNHSFQKSIIKRIEKYSHKISKLQERSTQLYNQGYLKIYMGVYSNLSDVKKKVRFPRFKVKLESTNQNIQSVAFGFVLYLRMNDTWGRFNTHFMKWIREQKEKKHSMHFYDVPNWMSFDVTAEEIKETDYKPIHELRTTQEEKLSDAEKRKKQMDLLIELSDKEPVKFKKLLKETGVYNPLLQIAQVKKKQKRKLNLPLLYILNHEEIMNYSKDWGLSVQDYRYTVGESIIKSINIDSTVDPNGYCNLSISEITNIIVDLEIKNQICVLHIDYIKWRETLHKLIIQEIKSWNAKN